MNGKSTFLLFLILVSLGRIGARANYATTFVYQGILQNGSSPASGLYDVQVELYDAAAGGNNLGNNTITAVPVTNGLFMISLNFGANPFQGQTLWLDIFVRTNGAAVWTELSPRQLITPVPYAIQAYTAGGVTTYIPPTGGNGLAIASRSNSGEPPASAEEKMPNGAVVIIDDAHAGQFKLADRPYDKRVAGVVSGPMGSDASIGLPQSAAAEAGRNVTHNGTVQVLADASNGPIEPGDLLTTSSAAGYAMKATDPEKSRGSVLGKAMTRLDSGRGLVLVLVSLQ